MHVARSLGHSGVGPTPRDPATPEQGRRRQWGMMLTGEWSEDHRNAAGTLGAKVDVRWALGDAHATSVNQRGALDAIAFGGART